MSNPLLETVVDTIGRDYYAFVWKNKPWYSKVWWTLRGWAPGGRKGAPAL